MNKITEKLINFTITEESAKEFLKRLKILRNEIMENLSEEDYKHFKKFKRKHILFKVLAYGTAPFCPNPISSASFGISRIGNWLSMHFISHKAYDKVPGFPERLKSKNFAKGNKRFIEWLDWILPEAWDYEHNVLHHSYTGEAQDPDVIELNLGNLLSGNYKNLPSILKATFIIFTMCTWRFSYYAPNTLAKLLEKENSGEFKNKYGRTSNKIFLNKKLWLECYFPYIFYHFILTPGIYTPLGPIAVTNVLINSIIGEIIANIYSFIIIGTNHTGEDVYRFSNKSSSNIEKIFRQIIGSVNFKTSGDWNDFFHMYLNYQIEHHIWPDLPMSVYAKIQPKIKSLCEEFGVPYIQESVWIRLKKTFQNMMVTTQMKVTDKIVKNR